MTTTVSNATHNTWGQLAENTAVWGKSWRFLAARLGLAGRDNISSRSNEDEDLFGTAKCAADFRDRHEDEVSMPIQHENYVRTSKCWGRMRMNTEGILAFQLNHPSRLWGECMQG